MDFQAVIGETAKEFGYNLRCKQEEAILAFLHGHDVFVSLPTGYGKSLCYTLLPALYDKLRNVEKKSIVMVVSPLTALMQDQVTNIKSKGISAACLVDESLSNKKEIKKGSFQVLLVSPETLSSPEWRNMLASTTYSENMIGFVIDEAHCIKKWGESFRTEFSHLGEIRSIVPEGIKVMALTATATLSTRRYIIRSLNMLNPTVVYMPPVKNNIAYYVMEKEETKLWFKPIIDKLRSRTLEKTIVFCRTYEDIIQIHQCILHELLDYCTEPKGSPNYVKNRVLDIFTHCTHPSIKTKILEQFTKIDSPLKLVIATISFGMGVDCPHVRQVIHWGIPEDVEVYIQESGRAGRDGEPARAIIVKHPRDLNFKRTSQQMIDYCTSKTQCRRAILYSDFPDCGDYPNVGCLCCDVCAHSCVCGHCNSKMRL